MSIRNRSMLGVAALAGLAACSDATNPTRSVTPSGASLSQTPDIVDQTGRHLFRTKQWHEVNDAAKPGSGGTSNTGIFYHGGPVLLSGTNVAAVYWATSPIYNGGPTPGTHGPGSSDGSLIGTFLRSLGGSPYFNINSTYTDGSGNHIANSVNYTQFWANNSFNVPSGSQSVSDADMVAMLQNGFDTGALTWTANTLYAIFTPGAVNLGGGFGTQYCAYHYHGTVTVNGAPQTVLYAAMPYDAQYPTACTNNSGSPNNDAGADAEVNTLAHETEETTTDLMGTAWFDHRGYENADKCAWTWGTTQTAANGALYNLTLGGKNWLVQQNWINSGTGGCRMSF